MGRRAAVVPRSVYPLLALLVLAALWLWRGDGGPPDGARPLFDIGPEAVASCEVRGPEIDVVLARDPAAPAGWRLGGALPDRADADGVANLLDELTEARGGAQVAGPGWTSLPEDFDLDGPGLFGVRLVAVDGRHRLLRIGARNPASGLYYATGAGREDLFTVQEDLVGALSALPDAVRARALWPGFARGQADTVRLRFPGGDAGVPSVWDLFARDAGGRWWLRLPPDGWSRTGEVATAYHRRHADRRRRGAGADWLRARDREIANLLSYLESDRVRDFLPPGVAPQPDGFAVRVAGARGAALAVPHEVVYGEPETETRVPAWRDGFAAGLVLPAEIVDACAGGLPGYLHTDVLTRAVASADSFALARPGLGRVAFAHTDDGWRLTASSAPGNREQLELMGRDLAFHLDHLAIARVLDPRPDDPLGPPRTSLTIWRTGPGAPPRTEVRFGLLDAVTPAAWFPADGRLVAVDREILITFQTVLMTAVGIRR